MAMLEIVRASKHFGAVRAVDRVTLAVDSGAFFALLGPSGCGKTTLLRMIAGFEAPDEGHILIDGREVTVLPPYARPVNMMFQSYALFPHMDVAQNVAFGLRQQRMERRRIAARVEEMLALVQMSDCRRRRPHELSGGQRQRVALARALARAPKLLLLDEPLAALDRKLRDETRIELTGLQQRLGTTFLVVTHDQEEALSMASQIAVMHEGRLVQIGPPADLYERPNSRFVAGFIGEINLFEGDPVTGREGPALRVAGLAEPIPLPADGAGQGRPVLALRPEKLVLSQARPPGFAIAAEVTAIGYLGGLSAIRLAAGGRELKARVPSPLAAGLKPGSPVWASWARDDAIVIEE